MMIKRIQHILLLFTLMIIASCGEEQFSTKANQKKDSTAPLSKNNLYSCSSFTLIRPQVDILFLWDNSTSQAFINEQTKSSLRNVVNTLSDRFDYHIALAPLLLQSGQGVNNELKVVARNPADINASAQSYLIPKSAAATSLTFSPVPGNSENGVQRAYDLLNANRTNGIFRTGAYTIIALMSNQDDNSWVVGSWPTGFDRNNYINTQLNKLLCLRGGHGGSCGGIPTLNSEMMRFITVVAGDRDHNGYCSSQISSFNVGHVYEKMSSLIYSAPYNNGKSQPVDQNGATLMVRGSDSYHLFDNTDICEGNYSNIFDGINNAIQDSVIKHVYRYWPVAESGASINLGTLLVQKPDGTTISPIPSSTIISRDLNGKNDIDTGTGFKISGYRYVGDTTQNTRFLPTVGEPSTGHLVELFGDAKITYPECLRVTSDQATSFYGYIHLGTIKPLESSISLSINGVAANNSSTNGWTLIKQSGQPLYHNNGLNIRIKSPTNTSSETPAVMKGAGYYVKVNGSAIYSDGANIDVNFLPAN